ncbi:SulP family inorganic anion transporter [Betaproteobacteria bacterium SCN1]|jgi:SulP family sulfate permease|nr:SulP family inorganic anion transporter [Betaproteobacteria bacterium SCN1]MBN8758905.1 SulP family inorganic anion transporter [Thiobacillus sp.]ODU91000.1 MAG: sodium-independent anion transporter [Thiobacillus sp. SCN 65-179]OJW37903.1 MAG: sodium-independent anion transporter [Thiobacillus sp. 65-69]
MSTPFSTHTLPTWLKPFTAFLQWWPLVNRNSTRIDTMAGLTGALVALPQCVAFATIAGMPPEYGLYAGMIPAIVAALFGSSWHLVSGPTTAASIVLFSVLAPHAEPGSAEYVKLALTLTFMVGIVQVVMGLAKLGTLVNFISHSVVTGFTAGAAILIATNQVKHFTGLDIPRGSDFATVWGHAFTHLSDIHTDIALTGLVTLLLGVAVKRWMPRLPYMIVAMLGGSLFGYFVARASGAVLPAVGALPATLPPLSMPSFAIEDVRTVASGVIAVTLLALTEAVSIARALAARSGQHVDGNQEFVGQGLSNIAGAFFSGYVATGSFNRSGVNFAAGAKTPMAAILAGAFLILLVLLVAPWAQYLPNAAMAGILFMVAWGLIDFDEIFHTLKSSRQESAILLTTFACTLFLTLEEAIIVGVLMSLAIYLARTSKPQVRVRVPDPHNKKRRFMDADNAVQCPQLRFVRIDGSLFFGATSHIRENLAAQDVAAPGQKHVAVVAHGINFIDLAGAHYLAEEAQRRRALGGGLYFIRVKDTVQEQLAESGALKTIGGINLFDTKTEAIETIYSRLDPEVCKTCRARIFRECRRSDPAQAPAPQGGMHVAHA